MVATVSEALHVSRTNAQLLVQSLTSAGLVEFEQDQPAVSVARHERQFVPAGPARASASPGSGVWRIGPSV
jgi:DNA-binding IclR family transcriptional regulator